VRKTKQKYKRITVTKSPYPGRICNNVSAIFLFVPCINDDQKTLLSDRCTNI